LSEGIVFLVGAGPGDPDLITVKAFMILKKADVIVYDRLVSKELLETLPNSAEKIYVGKHSSNHPIPQSQIVEMLVRNAKQGKKVVRLKGGDPFLFGRGGEEAEYLKKEGVKFEVIPGISSALAAPAYFGIPVTHRYHSSSVAIVTGHEDPDKKHSRINWEKLATVTDTIVVLMGIKRLNEITDSLIKGGLDQKTPAAIIEWGTTKQQRITEGLLNNLHKKASSAGVKPPAVIVIGEVVKLREKLSWFSDIDT